MVGGEEGLNNVCLPVFPCSRRKVYPDIRDEENKLN